MSIGWSAPRMYFSSSTLVLARLTYVAGFVLGAGTASERLVDLDFQRERFMSEADRQDLAAELAAPRGPEGPP